MAPSEHLPAPCGPEKTRESLGFNSYGLRLLRVERTSSSARDHRRVEDGAIVHRRVAIVHRLRVAVMALSTSNSSGPPGFIALSTKSSGHIENYDVEATHPRDISSIKLNTRHGTQNHRSKSHVRFESFDLHRPHLAYGGSSENKRTRGAFLG